MLIKNQQKLLEQLLSSVNHEQKIWLAGYMQGQIETLNANTTTGIPNIKKPPAIIYFATETGNAKGLSLQVMKAIKAAGYKVKASAVNRLKIKDIKPDTMTIFIVSTHGEGDPPESALPFFEDLHNADDGQLNGLNYAVAGLGDTSYELFCGAATKMDKELQRLGGKPFQAPLLFDVDYATHTSEWIEQTVKSINDLVGANTSVAEETLSLEEELIIRTGKGYTRLEPVKGVVKHIVCLNDIDSTQQTFHIEIEYEDDIIYTCGDAAGVMLPDKDHNSDNTPRLYSISSSPSYHEGEIHLTVALATHENEDGSMGYGTYSRYLADRQEGDEIEFYIHQNQIFNLAADNKDIIMIGPGTGIAPFRSFIYERSERGAVGRNWLFFGAQHMHCDFLYQTEWQEHLATETLHKIDLAFSRDQTHKIYVQDRLKEKAKEIMEWIDNGAILYLCGTRDPMSKDIDQVLIDIIAAQKSLSPEEATNFVADLEENDRYLKDVY